MSKLYTEEQVIAGFTVFRGVTQDHAKKVVELLTPIELPTDEEVEEVAEKTLSVNFLSFIEGAKWVRDKIKGGGDD